MTGFKQSVAATRPTAFLKAGLQARSESLTKPECYGRRVSAGSPVAAGGTPSDRAINAGLTTGAEVTLDGKSTASMDLSEICRWP